MNRLFLAIEASTEVRISLSEWMTDPKERLDRQGMRWIPSSKLLVNLAVLGDLDVAEVVKVAAPLIGKTKAPTLAIGRITGLPDTKRPGALVLGVLDEGEVLCSLHAKLESALSLSDEEYTPHIALARMKPASTKLGHKLRDYMHSGKLPEPMSWTPAGVSLLNSNPDGSFTQLEFIQFG